MQDTAKYLIHAKISADGVVERSDVVGAVFGQTEGLLGDDLDLRELQDSSKVGRIDVSIESEGGQSFGDVTIASSLDKVETAILAASLETISRVGPCQARIEVTNIEDVRAAKRRIVVQRAKELLADSFEETVLTSDELHEEVRESVRVGKLSEYEGLPAGPNVAEGNAVVIVEGRADVARLLEFGVKNAIAVEGTNVPEAVAELTEERTTTAFLDGDRGGQLILRELDQIGDVDFVAFAPEGESVEDLQRGELLAALREKTPYEVYQEAQRAASAESARAVATGGRSPAERESSTDENTPSPVINAVREEVEKGSDGSIASTPQPPASETGCDSAPPAEEPRTEPEAPTETDEAGDERQEGTATADAAATTEAEPAEEGGPTLGDHVRAVVGEGRESARLLDAEFGLLEEVPAEDAFDAVEASDGAHALIIDDRLDQPLLDVAAESGLSHAVAAETGEFVKQPTMPQVRPVDGFLN
ncbi:MAG: DNA primase DnaG [Halolamina sp.]|uniref:DNA primase DnaG n=1 Tax=Halolamina sp. TaxID=1940283 RepID=UPI002FC2E7C6